MKKKIFTHSVTFVLGVLMSDLVLALSVGLVDSFQEYNAGVRSRSSRRKEHKDTTPS